MQATYDPTKKTKFTTSHRKEGACRFEQYTVISPVESFGEAVVARIYRTDRTVYACLWVHASLSNPHHSREIGEVHASGTGKAGGGGYHKASAALDGAISNAGFTLSEDISGVGEGAMERALLAIANAIGVFSPRLIHAHQ